MQVQTYDPRNPDDCAAIRARIAALCPKPPTEAERAYAERKRVRDAEINRILVREGKEAALAAALGDTDAEFARGRK